MSPRPARPAPRTLGRLALSPRVLLTAGFLALCAVLLVLVGRIVLPFLSALLWAGVLTLIVHPVFRWLLRLFRGSRTVAAAATTGLVALAAAGPAVLLTAVLLREMRTAAEGIRLGLQGGGGGRIVERLARLPAAMVPGLMDEAGVQDLERRLRSFGGGLVASAAASVTGGLNRTIANASKFFVSVVVLLFAVFYFLREGERWLRRLKETVPLAPAVWDIVVEKLSTTLRAVVHGLMLSAAILGALLGFCYYWFGVPLPVLLGMVSFVFAPIPFIGPVVVWGPACAWLYAGAGSPERALGLFAFGGAAIFVIDNFLRPTLIGSIARLPVLFMLVAILGGLLAYGPLGLFLGPVLLAIALAVAGIYREMVRRHLA